MLSDSEFIPTLQALIACIFLVAFCRQKNIKKLECTLVGRSRASPCERFFFIAYMLYLGDNTPVSLGYELLLSPLE